MAIPDDTPVASTMTGRRGPDGTAQIQVPGMDANATPQPQAPLLAVQERTPGAVTSLARLRRRFTPLGWAIVYDGRSLWRAWRKGAAPIQAPTPLELRVAIDAAIAARPTMPLGRGRWEATIT